MGGFVRNITGAKDQKKAAGQAAQQQFQATQQAAAAQELARNQTIPLFEPFRNVATPQVMQQYSTAATTPFNFSYNPRNDELVNYALDRSERALSNMAAAGGRANSGGLRQAIFEAGAPILMDRERQLYEQALNAGNNNFERLSSMISGAQNAAGAMGNAYMGIGNQISDLRTQGGNALAAGTIGRGNAQAQGFGTMLKLGGMVAGAMAGSSLGGGLGGLLGGGGSAVTTMLDKPIPFRF